MDWGYLFLSLIETVIFYMAFPMIILLMNHEKFEKKRAKKIALWNSIIVGAFFCILTAANSNSGVKAWSAAPAFLYYAINCAILTNKNSQSNINTISESIPPHSYQNISRPSQISNIDEIPKTYGDYNISSADIMFQKKENNHVVTETKKDSQNSAPKIQYCRKCGNKVTDDFIFCNKCGTKIR